jgi:UDP-N-acetylmuramate: L-alanyl-gamma-D-glutamyl-meso-diaminopimelate ligase
MLKPIRTIHFLGICGTAMGSVAAAIKDLGFTVTGSDANVYPPMSTFLESKGIPIQNGFRPENIPDPIDLIVIGNAMTRGNPELEAVLNRKLYYRSLPETIREFFLQGKHNIVVTGTHGKTTTTALVSWIFQFAKCAPSFLIGGIAKNLGQGALFSDSSYFVIEGDEYDTAFFDKRSKFLHYLPECLVINNVEYDHADIFKDLEEIKTSFRRLVNIVPKEGKIFINADEPNCRDVSSHAFAAVNTIGFGGDATYPITKVTYSEKGSCFEFLGTTFQTSLVGEFNIRNSAMAAAVAHSYGIPIDTISAALKQFEGIARRQEIRGEVNGIKVIVDFGHHPTAIRETLTALRHRYPGQRLWAIFEPRSNTTRRAVFQTALPEALGLADGVLLAQVARLEQLDPQDRLDPDRVVQHLKSRGIAAFYEPNTDSIVNRIRPLVRSGDVITVFSNGGFEGIHEKLLKALA